MHSPRQHPLFVLPSDIFSLLVHSRQILRIGPCKLIQRTLVATLYFTRKVHQPQLRHDRFHCVLLTALGLCDCLTTAFNVHSSTHPLISSNINLWLQVIYITNSESKNFLVHMLLTSTARRRRQKFLLVFFLDLNCIRILDSGSLTMWNKIIF